MSREEKAQIIESLQEAFTKCSIGILTDYRGLATPALTALRRKLQGSGGEYRVVKNTMARFAVTRAGREDLAKAFEGPIAIALGYGEITEPAKVLTNHIRESGINLKIIAAFDRNRLLTTEDVITLATLPSREIMLARVLGQMNSPITALANCLASPIRGLITVLQSQIKQLEGE